MRIRINSAIIGVCLCLAGGIFADGKITRISAATSMLELTIRTTVGKAYQLQCCSDLSANEWINLGTSFVASADETIRQVDAGASFCYFRVIAVQSDETLEIPPPPPPPPPPPSE